MSVPVLIAARNEAHHIGATLEALSCDVEPIVRPMAVRMTPLQ